MIDTALEYFGRFLAGVVATSVDATPRPVSLAIRIQSFRARLGALATADFAEVAAIYAEAKNLLMDLWHLL
jgi:hypothetical protein